jgi:hypothetical protein
MTTSAYVSENPNNFRWTKHRNTMPEKEMTGDPAAILHGGGLDQ